MSRRKVIFGCGDVGQRLLAELRNGGLLPGDLHVVNRRVGQYADAIAHAVDLDHSVGEVEFCHQAQLYYLVPPPAHGTIDLRSQALLTQFRRQQIVPVKVVLISTTGVYGDCGQDWVDESRSVNPVTARARRRLNAETQWRDFSEEQSFPLVILRVPGIYANSRIPRERLARRQPVVKAAECGFSNRIHADDLARCMAAAMQRGEARDVLNASDGCPSTITAYLQAAAQVLGMQPLPEISLAQARLELSEQMLSYLTESRRISNERMLEKLKVTLRYPDFIKGLKHG